jgi:hypothetical protein
MTRTLQYLQRPQPSMRRIGTSESGIIELPVLGGLTTDEDDWIAELTAAQEPLIVSVARAAERIAADEGISLVEAFDVVQRAVAGTPIEGDAGAIRLRQAQRIADVARLAATNGKRDIAIAVTALLRGRGGCPDWTIEDTQALPGAIRRGIYALAEDEQAAEMRRPAEPLTEEELGKPQPASTKRRARIGAGSSGT